MTNEFVIFQDNFVMDNNWNFLLFKILIAKKDWRDWERGWENN